MIYFLIFSPVCYKNVKFVTRNIIADDKIFVKLWGIGRYLAMTAHMIFALDSVHGRAVTTYISTSRCRRPWHPSQRRAVPSPPAL